MRELPQFADLMLIPRVIDSLAHVSVRDSQIHIVSDRSDDICEALKVYPNIRVERTGPRELVLIAVPMNSRLLLVHWPNGLRYAACQHEDHWLNLLNPDAVDGMQAAGLPVTYLEAQEHEQTIDQVLTRLGY